MGILAIDAIASGQGYDAAPTVAHECGASANAMVAVFVIRDSAVTISGATYNGDAMAFLADTSITDIRIAIYTLASPDTGASYDCIGTLSGSADWTVTVYSFNNGRPAQICAPSTSTANGTSTTPAVPRTPGGYNLMVDAVGVNMTATEDPLAYPELGQTEAGNIEQGDLRGLTSYRLGGTGMAWTLTSSATWLIIAFEVQNEDEAEVGEASVATDISAVVSGTVEVITGQLKKGNVTFKTVHEGGVVIKDDA